MHAAQADEELPHSGRRLKEHSNNSNNPGKMLPPSSQTGTSLFLSCIAIHKAGSALEPEQTLREGDLRGAGWATVTKELDAGTDLTPLPTGAPLSDDIGTKEVTPPVRNIDHGKTDIL